MTRAVINDRFRSIMDLVISGMPVPRMTAVNQDYSKNMDALAAFVLNPVPQTLTEADGPGYGESQFKTKKSKIPDPKNNTWVTPRRGI
jgi:hypothetical protein